VITGGSHKTNLSKCFTVTLTTAKANDLGNDATEQTRQNNYTHMRQRMFLFCAQ